MGWFWNSTPSAASNGAPKPATAQLPKDAPKQQRDEQDPGVQEFLDMFKNDPDMASTKPAASAPAPSPASAQQQSTTSNLASKLWSSGPPAAERPASAKTANHSSLDTENMTFAESLLPTEMSCRQAFDMAFGCNSISGQLKNIYRYGEARECSEKWDDFWFCMRSRAWGTARREAAVHERYKMKELSKYGPGKPSSEDVWDSRDEKVPHGSAFSHKLAQPTVSDQEAAAADRERRRRIRRELGYDDENQ